MTYKQSAVIIMIIAYSSQLQLTSNIVERMVIITASGRTLTAMVAVALVMVSGR